MDQPAPPVSSWLEIDVDLGFALFFLCLLCLFLFVTIVRCAQTVVDPYGAISTSTYQEEQINNWYLISPIEGILRKRLCSEQKTCIMQR